MLSEPSTRRLASAPSERPRATARGRRFANTAGRIIAVDKYYIEKLGVSALRPDARLLFFIMLRQSVSIKEAMLDSALSYRAFYDMLDRLKRHGLVSVEIDEEDRRVRRIVFGEQFDKIMGKIPHF